MEIYTCDLYSVSFHVEFKYYLGNNLLTFKIVLPEAKERRDRLFKIPF